MAEKVLYSRSYKNVTRVGDEEVALKPNLVVKLMSENEVAVANEGDFPFGVSQPNTMYEGYITPYGKPVDIIIEGVCEVRAGGDIKAGDKVIVSNGGVVVKDPGDVSVQVFGIALEDGVDGSLIKVLISREYIYRETES